MMRLAEEFARVSVPAGSLAVCALGQAGFLLKDSGGAVLVLDPYLTNCGERIRGFKRLSPMLLEPEELAADYYVTTHLHFDHFDYDAIPRVLAQPQSPLFLGPESCMEKLAELGAPRCVRLDRGEEYRDGSVFLRAVTADHGDMAPDAIGVLLEMGGKRLYFSGDTCLREDVLREVRDFGPEIAFLSVNGKFGNLNAREGVRAAELSGVRYAVPCHCWTFAEHGGDPGEFCRLAAEDGAVESVLLRQGEIRLF